MSNCSEPCSRNRVGVVKMNGMTKVKYNVNSVGNKNIRSYAKD